MNNLPTISIISLTYNTDLTSFKQMLKAIRMQKYPKKLLEHIIMDAGSTNGTIELARKYGVNIYIERQLKNKIESRASLGIKRSKGKLILFLQTDNIPTTADWLMRMVQPFLENKKIVCAFSAFNSYKKNMSTTTKYCALFGANDPTIYFLNKTEKIRLDQKKYNKGTIIKETNNYWVVKFTKNNLPTIGDNGHIFLRSVIQKVNKNPDNFIHVDAFAQLLDMGYDTYGVVKNSIIHVINPNLTNFVKRRVELKEDFYNRRNLERRYLVYNPNSMQDKINLFKYILFSITLIIPLVEAFRGYLKIRERAWFLHPVLCFTMVIGYGISELKWFLRTK